MNTRRNFLKVVGLGTLFSQVLFTKIASAASKIVAGLDSKTPDQRSKNFKYYTDAKKIPKDLMKGKDAIAKGKAIECSTCTLYTADAAKPGHGKCVPFFQQDWVNGKGVCPTWAPKA